MQVISLGQALQYAQCRQIWRNEGADDPESVGVGLLLVAFRLDLAGQYYCMLKLECWSSGLPSCQPIGNWNADLRTPTNIRFPRCILMAFLAGRDRAGHLLTGSGKLHGLHSDTVCTVHSSEV
jgi:hypothetical protein